MHTAHTFVRFACEYACMDMSACASMCEFILTKNGVPECVCVHLPVLCMYVGARVRSSEYAFVI